MELPARSKSCVLCLIGRSVSLVFRLFCFFICSLFGRSNISRLILLFRTFFYYLFFIRRLHFFFRDRLFFGNVACTDKNGFSQHNFIAFRSSYLVGIQPTSNINTMVWAISTRRKPAEDMSPAGIFVYLVTVILTGTPNVV